MSSYRDQSKEKPLVRDWPHRLWRAAPFFRQKIILQEIKLSTKGNKGSHWRSITYIRCILMEVRLFANIEADHDNNILYDCLASICLLNISEKISSNKRQTITQELLSWPCGTKITFNPWIQHVTKLLYRHLFRRMIWHVFSLRAYT